MELDRALGAPLAQPSTPSGDDFTTLMLSTLSWLCLVQRSWRWFAAYEILPVVVLLAGAARQEQRVAR